ncbi:MAG: hypothetical protein HY288_05430 [Planctomycetia bacterium]|nr:hypothetical protein [Planctomycetia bacterium]
MQSTPSNRSGPALVAWACFFVAVAGCGTADYESLLNRQLNDIRAGAPFRTLFGPTELSDTPIKIRVPMAFKHSYMENSSHPDDGAKISPDRVQPPFLPLPGFKLCYESQVENVEGRPPFYCYLAAIPSKPGDAQKLAADLQAKLKAKFNDTPDAWEELDANTPQNKGLPWKKIRVTGEQPFRVTDVMGIVSKNLPGVFELWMHDAQDYIVLVGWRAPSSIEGPASAQPPPSMSPTGVMTSAAQDVRPDFSTMPALTAGTLTIEQPAGSPPAEGNG